MEMLEQKLLLSITCSCKINNLKAEAAEEGEFYDFLKREVLEFELFSHQK